MKNKLSLLLLFLSINFGGLALGSFLMNNGPKTDWYLNLNKASWTPPGWVFGFAWFTIMICFSIYLTSLFKVKNQKKIWLYISQVVLNISWNYVFFARQQIAFGLVIITLLTGLIFYFYFTYQQQLKATSYWLFPYMIWLCIATSLNLYIVVHN